MFVEIHKELYRTLPFVLCTLGENRSQGEIRRPEGFEFHQFIWIVEGAGIFSVNSERFPLERGEGIFFRRGVPHGYAGSGEMHTAWFTFLGAESVLDYYGVGDYFRFQAPPFLTAAAAALLETCMGNSSIISRSAAGYSWMADLMETLFADSAPVGAQVRRFLENHYGEPLTLDEIAAQVGLNRFSLCHLYQKEQGITMMEQLKKIRIAKAKQLLRYSARSIGEIGRLCGFESPSYFGKRFREETGCSPRTYRETGKSPV